MTLSNRKCQFLYKKKIGRTLLYEVSPKGCFLFFGGPEEMQAMPAVLGDPKALPFGTRLHTKNLKNLPLATFFTIFAYFRFKSF
jgi:hypothetical protein